MDVKSCLWSELKNKQCQVKFATNNIKETLIVCDCSIKRGVTFDVVLYRNQRPVNCILHFTELHIGSSIRYKYTFVGNYFL